MAAQPKKKLYQPDAPENRYPKMVYPGVPKLGTGKIVNSAEEEEAFLASFAPKEAPTKDPEAETEEASDDIGKNDKDALLAEAKDLGIEADRRWGVDRLKAAIAEKKGDGK